MNKEEILMERIVKDTLLSCAVLTIAYFVSIFFIGRLPVINNSGMIFMVAVVLISRYTEGYLYGVVSSAISVFLLCIN